MAKKFLLLILFLFIIKTFLGQQGTINPSNIAKWPYVDGGMISDDGQFVAYQIHEVSGKQRIVVKSTKGDWKKQFIGASSPKFSSDGELLLLQSQSDTIALIELGGIHVTYLSGANFQISQEKEEPWMCYFKSDANVVILRNLKSGYEQTFVNSTDYKLSENGKILVVRHDSIGKKFLDWIITDSKTKKTIWSGYSETNNYQFNQTCDYFAFMTHDNVDGNLLNKIWYYKAPSEHSLLKVDNSTLGIDSDKYVSNSYLKFSKDGTRIFFQAESKSIQKSGTGVVSVDVWNYKDNFLQSHQLHDVKYKVRYNFAIGLNDDRATYLSRTDVERLDYNTQGDDSWGLIQSQNCYDQEAYWRKSCLPALHAINTKSGLKKLVKDSTLFSAGAIVSPNNKFIIYYDYSSRNYFSYEIATDKVRNITRTIPVPIYTDESARAGVLRPSGGVNLWFSGDTSLIVYDQYDIWKVDPLTIKRPICLTNGFGRANHIKFRLMREGMVHNSDDVIISFDLKSKQNGFYRINLNKQENPKRLLTGPYIFYWPFVTGEAPQKAKNAKAYIIQRQSEKNSPNYFFTNDFVHLEPLSNECPETNYNWVNSELYEWKSFDGQMHQGILYKPNNFNVRNKYPVIFNFYEERSDELHKYFKPDLTGSNINIPYFVSREYLVFVPDIHYKTGRTAESIYNSVVSAAQSLANEPYVDKQKMGIQGHSFGGYEVNVLITMTNLFAAAAEASGISDIVSGYNTIQDAGFSKQFQGEVSQYRIGATLWQTPDLYIKNSPVFFANKIRTPILMMNNKGDHTVAFEQGLELFLSMRRLDKPAWMLQYDNGEHQLYRGNDPLDYTIRLTQFFDHYLKSAPAPIWMSRGIPARLKQIETGYAYDPSNNCGRDCKVCKYWNEKYKKDSAACWKEIEEKTKSENWMGGGQ